MNTLAQIGFLSFLVVVPLACSTTLETRASSPAPVAASVPMPPPFFSEDFHATDVGSLPANWIADDGVGVLERGRAKCLGEMRSGDHKIQSPRIPFPANFRVEIDAMLWRDGLMNQELSVSVGAVSARWGGGYSSDGAALTNATPIGGGADNDGPMAQFKERRTTLALVKKGDVFRSLADDRMVLMSRVSGYELPDPTSIRVESRAVGVCIYAIRVFPLETQKPGTLAFADGQRGADSPVSGSAVPPVSDKVKTVGDDGIEPVDRNISFNPPGPAAVLSSTQGGPRLIFPVRIGNGWIFSWQYDPRRYGPHNAVDIAVEADEPVLAVTGGKVAATGSDGGTSNSTHNSFVFLVHGDGTKGTLGGSRYFRLSKAAVRVGEAVLPGQVIGHVGGNPGDYQGVLHFELLGWTVGNRLDYVAQDLWIDNSRFDPHSSLYAGPRNARAAAVSKRIYDQVRCRAGVECKRFGWCAADDEGKCVAAVGP